MEAIKINGIEYPIHEDVLKFIETIGAKADELESMKTAHHMLQSREEASMKIIRTITNDNDGLKFLIGKLLRGEKVELSRAEIYKFAAAEIYLQFEAEAKVGLIGWIQENWQTICKCPCACGKNLVSYDLLRSTSKFICHECAPKP